MAAAAPGSAAVRRPGGALRRRDFRLFWAGETVSELGTTVNFGWGG
jgi:hypothetical protein